MVVILRTEVLSDLPSANRTVYSFYKGATSRDLLELFRAVSESVIM